MLVTDPDQRRRSLITLVAVAATQRWRLTLAALVMVVAAGFAAFVSGLDREGFPPVNTPISIVAGSWFVDDAELVDSQVVAPLVGSFEQLDEVRSTRSTARPNSFVVVVQFDPEVGSETGTAAIAAVAPTLPDGVAVQFDAVNAARFVGRFDALVSLVAPPGATPADLDGQAAVVAEVLEADSSIERAEVRELVTETLDPANGTPIERQTRFTRVLRPETGARDAVAVGVIRAEDSGLDVLAFSDRLDDLLDDASVQLAAGYEVLVTADFATGVRDQIGSLTSNLRTGLIAVSLVSLLLIGWRVAVLTAGFMTLVMIGASGGLWAVGQSLNTITLFGLILTLGLIVDDAIVISESIDADRRAGQSPTDVVRAAVDRVGSPSFAGTLTTVVVFSPMLFVTGILGEFIQPIPTTVILTLLLSFAFSIVFIPLVAGRFLAGDRALRNPVARAERRASAAAGRLAAYPSGNGWRGRVVGGVLAATAVVALLAAGSIAGRLGFSIFPAGKDAISLTVSAEFPPGSSIDDAERVADRIDEVLIDELGDDLDIAQYLRGNERVLDVFVDLTPIGTRSPAPELVERLDARLAGIEGGRIGVAQAEVGPPTEEFPFAAQIAAAEDPDSLAAAESLAFDLLDELDGLVLRVAGQDVTVAEAVLATEGEIARTDGERFLEVRARFDRGQVTGNVNATQTALEQAFPASDLAARGLAADAISFDFGLESDNQEDFAALGLAGLAALVLMLLVLTVQFRSLAQALLIFLAIPFSLFGVVTALALTDNPLSFLVTVGVIALVGVAVNNTILIVDAANRARRAGATPAEAIGAAVTQRFRPLLATTATTVVGLLPLSLSDPFWESLGFTLIGGLISSTTLVLLAFPVAYLALEAVRTPARNLVRRRLGRPEVDAGRGDPALDPGGGAVEARGGRLASIADAHD